ncbi:MAG TPA: hypothetical protein VGK99_15445 [Acidobacteriota bacterium]|jgi:hypothetical protein
MNVGKFSSHSNTGTRKAVQPNLHSERLTAVIEAIGPFDEKSLCVNNYDYSIHPVHHSLAQFQQGWFLHETIGS